MANGRTISINWTLTEWPTEWLTEVIEWHAGNQLDITNRIPPNGSNQQDTTIWIQPIGTTNWIQPYGYNQLNITNWIHPYENNQMDTTNWMTSRPHSRVNERLNEWTNKGLKWRMQEWSKEWLNEQKTRPLAICYFSGISFPILEYTFRVIGLNLWSFSIEKVAREI